MNIIEITPGDDNHLIMMMAKYHLNHVTGKDREHLLAYAKDVWNAAIAEEREASKEACRKVSDQGADEPGEFMRGHYAGADECFIEINKRG